MKNSILMVSLLLLTSMSVGVASTTDTGKKKKGNSTTKLGTSFKFDGSTLRGKYQTSLGTSATVENDKYLDDLLGGRKHFEDRVKKDDQRN